MKQYYYYLFLLFGKIVYLLLLAYHEGYNSGMDKWQKCMGQGVGWVVLCISMYSLAMPPSQHINVFTDPALQISMFKSFS